jgi:hypothetical protein
MKISQPARLILVSMMIASCATQQPEKMLPLKRYTQPTWDSAFIRLYERAACIGRCVQSVEGYGSMQIHAPEVRQSLSCVLKVKRHEGMQMVATVFLGIVAAETLLRTDSIFVYIPFQNTLLVGQNNPENLRRTTGIEANFKDAIDIFLCAPELTLPIDSLEGMSQTGKTITYTLRTAKGFQIVEIDSATAQVQVMAQLDTAKRTQIQVSFEQPETLINGSDTIYLPKQATISVFEHAQPLDLSQQAVERRIRLAYSERIVNGEPFALSFTIPHDAVQRRIEDLLFFTK